MEEDILTTVADDLKLLTMREVLEKTGMSRPTMYLRVKQGTFPRPRMTGGSRSARWLSTEIDAWIRELPAVSGGVYGDLDPAS